MHDPDPSDCHSTQKRCGVKTSYRARFCSLSQLTFFDFFRRLTDNNLHLLRGVLGRCSQSYFPHLYRSPVLSLPQRADSLEWDGDIRRRRRVRRCDGCSF